MLAECNILFIRKEIVMRTWLACTVAIADLLVAGVSAVAQDKAAGPMVVHSVYFSLKDNTPEAKKKLVESCKKYLTKHEGEVYFAAGTLAEEFDRPVNDRDFDVALLIIFKDKAAHDKYQEADRHQKFIDENKDNWKKVRVFDAAVMP
jgi:hypothetical protein